MMAKSHKRALYYTVVCVYIHVCTPQNFIFAKKLWGTYATKTFYVYIAKKSIFLCCFILVMMSCFQCNFFHKMHWACCKMKTNLCKKSSSWNHKKLFHTRYHPKQFFANLFVCFNGNEFLCCIGRLSMSNRPIK